MTLSVLALMVGIVNSLTIRRGADQDRIQLLRDLRCEWQELEEDWSTVVLAAKGADEHYVVAHPMLRSAMQELQDEYEENSFLAVQPETASWVARSVGRIVSFLDWAAVQVFEGRIRPSELHQVVGDEFARHNVVIRMLTDGDMSASGGAALTFPRSVLGLRPFTAALVLNRLKTRRVQLLGDLMWAQYASNGGAHTFYVQDIGLHKRTSGSGIANAQAAVHTVLSCSRRWRRHSYAYECGLLMLRALDPAFDWEENLRPEAPADGWLCSSRLRWKIWHRLTAAMLVLSGPVKQLFAHVSTRVRPDVKIPGSSLSKQSTVAPGS